jgi:hypothetical protein
VEGEGAYLQAVEAVVLRRLAAVVEAGHPHQPEEAEVGLLRREGEEAALPDHADLLAPAALRAVEEEAAVSCPRCPAPGQELQAPLQRSGRSR